MKLYSRSEKLMGCQFSLGLYAKEEAFAKSQLTAGIAEIRRIECLLSEFLPDSELSRINSLAPKKLISIDQECFALIDRSIEISKLTKGSFDITVGPLKKLYKFKNEEFQFPDPKAIKKALKSVGYQKVILDKSRKAVKFNKPNMKVSFAAIGKGYAADMVKELWKRAGVYSGFINASGDISTFGRKPPKTETHITDNGSVTKQSTEIVTLENTEEWIISIAHPDDRSKMLFHVPIYNAAVATSGDYEQHFLYEGQRYSHNIDPANGQALQGLKSVTVISPSAELSDALATACYVMGVEKSLTFIESLPHTHCIIITDQNKTFKTKDIRSHGLK